MKVTVYIPTHNYGRFIEKAITSVLAQTMDDWELIVINDGSNDNTREILKRYEDHLKIKILEQEKRGLSFSNNIALRISNGKYLMRLDADDYLDENALLVLSNVLDTKPEIGLVYPDYYLVDEEGEVLEIVRRKKIREEVDLLDLPAQGACTMIRKECLLAIGGYNEEFRCQDGYELWINFLESFKPYNVNIPLFYYRQHDNNMTKNKKKILETRRHIKRTFVNSVKKNEIPRVLAVVPVIKRPKSAADEAFNNLNGRPLIWYTLNEVANSKMIEKTILTSDDGNILDYSRNFENIISVSRPEHFARSYSKVGEMLLDLLDTLKRQEDFVPDAVMVLYINTPFRRMFHIEKSIDTMVIFNVDTVISVSEEVDYFYQHEKYGLVPINKQKGLSLERKALYRGNGTITLTRTTAITEENILGNTIGHIIMLPEESIKIRTNFDLWLARKIASEWGTGS